MSRLRRDAEKTVRCSRARDFDAAIIGIGCRLPGANSPDDFWRLLLAEQNLITTFPADRARRMAEIWSTAAGAPTRAACPGGYVEGVELFDANFFGLSPKEAELMDPQQRLLLETTWHAFEDAGIKPSEIAGSNTGVYVGVCNTDYGEILDENASADDLYVTTGTFASMLANRTSFFFDLLGPSVSVDSSCSSSLVAIHNAVRALRGAECEMALVCGVNLCLTPKRFRSFRSGGMLSAEGQCKTFDAGADGYVRGEGVLTVILKRLDRAREDRDRIYGVIRGSAANHGGRTRGLTVTSPTQQARLIVEACRDADVPPGSLGYVEAHGTGTTLGDPVEFLGLKEALQSGSGEEADAQQIRCMIGSVKTNIGHLEAAAGIAGLVKVALSLCHRTIPASLNFRTLNPLIKLEGTTLEPAIRSQAWLASGTSKNAVPRRAGVSSFGFGGAYAHVVMEEWPSQPQPVIAPPGTVFLLVSAKDEEGLRRQSGSLANFLERGPKDDLASIARALQMKREAMEHRLCFPVSDRNEAIAILSAFARSRERDLASQRYHHGRAQARIAQTNAFAIDPALCQAVGGWLSEEGREREAAIWATSDRPDWTSLHGDAVAAHVDLPLYAFAPVQHWVSSNAFEVGDECLESKDVEPCLNEVVVPVWDAVIPVLDEASVSCTKRWLLIGTRDARRIAAEKYFPDHEIVDPEGLDKDAIVCEITSAGPFDGVVWFGPSAGRLGCQEPKTAVEQGAIASLFAIADVLQQEGAKHPPSGIIVMTDRSLEIPGDEWHDPSCASIFPLVGTIAHRFPQQGLSVFDTAESGSFPWPAVLALHEQSRQAIWAFRHGEWYRHTLVPASFDTPPVTRYRQGGSYIVAGASRSGLLIGEHLIRRYGARVILISDQPFDTKLALKLAEMASGQPPSFLSYDAASPAAMKEVFQEARRECASIDGIIQVADENAATATSAIDENDPLAAHRRRLELGLVLQEVFGEDNPDFVLMVRESRCESRTRSNTDYIALASIGCHLAKAWPCGVKVAEWGGQDRSDPRFEAERLGLVAGLLDGPFKHLVLRHNGRNPKEDDAMIVVLPDMLPIPTMAGGAERPADDSLSPLSQILREKLVLDGDLEALLSAILHEVGAAETYNKDGAQGLEEWIRRRSLPPTNAHWLRRSCEELAQRGLLAPFTDASVHKDSEIPGVPDAWLTWRSHREQWRQRNMFTAQVSVLDAVLPQLPAILLGTKQLTEVLFPGSKMGLMEGYYRSDPTAQHFNGILGDWLFAYLSERLERDPSSRLRLLEVGAGTGGTTGCVLSKLTPIDHAIAEYRYTDISQAFLAHGREQYGAAPFMRFALLNMEQAPQAQGIELGTYDVLIANNVLHATRDVRETIQHAKTALRRNGVLLLNEVNEFDLFLHVAFGLFDGWWRFRDPMPRIPGTPALSANNWARVLAEQGFESVTFPAARDAALGQDIIVAVSDGAVRMAGGQAVHAPQSPMDRQAIPEALPPGSGGADVLSIRVRDALLAIVGESLKIDVATIELEKSFSDYGMDSIVGVKVIQRVNGALGTDLSTICLFEHPNPRVLISHIVKTYGAELAFPPEAEPPPSVGDGTIWPAPRPVDRTVVQLPSGAAIDREPIAVIGMSGRCAGSASLDELWSHLAQGEVLVRHATRWDVQARFRTELPPELPPQGQYCRRGGFLDDIAGFDPMFFGISGAEAVCMDPQQRIFLEEAWLALENAGYAGTEIEGSRCGIYVGYIGGDYEELFPDLAPPQTMWGNAGSMLAARIAYVLNLQGPAITIDTACSSSLVAMHVACQGLWTGEIDTALAGGVFVQSTPSFFVSANRAAMLSPEGVCYAFDERANGFVPGEGAGVVVLKRLKDALAAGDQIHGVIRGSGINQDGASNGITAPNMLAQTQLQRQIYDSFGIDPATISLVEAHGTGTKLGDPIEMEALARTFLASGSPIASCAVGSVKANIGHTAAAAGVLSVIKVLLALKHGQIPPQPNYQTLNSAIRAQGNPFYVPTTLKTWTPMVGAKRLAAVSSYGLSGTNAHMVIEEAPHAPLLGRGRRAHLFVLSAKSEGELARQVEQMLDYCRTSPGDIGDICHTLLRGRRHFVHRFACVVSNQDDLAAKLERWLAGEAGDDVKMSIASAWTSEERAARQHAGDELIERVARSSAGASAEDLVSIAELFRQGHDLDYAKLFEQGRYRRITLPTYPFARDRYWITDSASAAQSKELKPSPALPGHRSARFHFTGTEPFLTDHRVRGGKVLAGVYFLELARSALGEIAGSGNLIVEGMAWLRSVVLDEPGELDVQLEEIAGGGWNARISRDAQDGAEVVHATARLSVAAPGAHPRRDLEGLRRRVSKDVGVSALYRFFSQLGVEYGPTFRCLEHVAYGEAENGDILVLADLAAPRDEGAPPSSIFAPGLLDSALQATFAPLIGDSGAINPRLLFSLDHARFWAALPQRAVVIARCAGGSSNTWQVDICDPQGEVCLEMTGVAFREGHLPASQETRSTFAEANYTLARRHWAALRDSVPDLTPTAGEGARLVLLDSRFGGRADALRRRSPAAIVQSLAGARSPSPASRAEALGLQIMASIQEALGSPGLRRKVVQVVVPYLDPTDPDLAVYRTLSGFVRTARLEHPDLHLQIINITDSCSAYRLGELLEEDAAYLSECEVAHIGEDRLVARHVEVDPMPVAGKVWKDDGVYLITGGAGGLGLIFAQEILSQTDRATVVLAGRRPRADISLPDAEHGRIEYHRLDLGDGPAVQACIDAILSKHGRLDGVLHAAGTLGDQLLTQKAPESFSATLSAKTFGAVHLDAATRDLPLDWFILFSSMASVVGNVGQVDYASANAFLDGFADHREALVAARRRRGRTISINWPWWRCGGMQIAPQLHEGMIQRGLHPMQSAAGLDAFYDVLGASGQVAVLAGAGDHVARVLREANGYTPPGPVDSNFSVEIQKVSMEGVLSFVRRTLAQAFNFPVDRVGPSTPFEDLGLDSILALQAVAALEKTLGPLPKTLLFETRSASELAERIGQVYPDRLTGLAAPRSDPSRVDRPLSTTIERSIADEPRASSPMSSPYSGGSSASNAQTAAAAAEIAIVGLAGRYPGADNLAQFWDNLKNGIDSVTEVGSDRWDHGRYFDPEKGRSGKTYSKWGGFLSGVAEFDAAFFNISPREAETMDPQERLFLQCAFHTLEDAGYSRARMGRDTGVFVGVMYTDYPLFAAEAQARGESLSYLNHPSSIANRVSHQFDFNGPSIAVDTMCSSSLTAIHLACQSILAGECTAAIAGGVNLTIHPNKYLGLAKGLFASSRGRCETFGNGGDGYVPSEGVGAILLKSLAQARHDGDRIYGIIKGSAVNHGGRTSGYSVPNPVAQQAVIARALARAGVNARAVTYLEAHGTGTALGDPIEIAGLSNAFAQQTGERGFCAIGSVKSNIGHCEGAAGIAGLTKVLLQLKHGLLVPSLHCTEVNDAIDFAATPFRVQRTLAAWPATPGDGEDSAQVRPRLAGISSFGAGGANVHLLVEEHRDERPTEYENAGDRPNKVLLPFSSRSPEALQRLVGQFLASIDANEFGEQDLANIAFTLQEGRDAFDHRLIVRPSSIGQLRAKLAAWLEGAVEQEDVYVGTAGVQGGTLYGLHDEDDIAETVSRWISKGKLKKLCRAWVQGWPIDWAVVNDRARGRNRILSLPGYPFARDHYWVPTAESAIDLRQDASERLSNLSHSAEGVQLLEWAWRPRRAQVGTVPPPEARVVLGTADFASHIASVSATRPSLSRSVMLDSADGAAARIEAHAGQLMAEVQRLLREGITQPRYVQLVVTADEQRLTDLALAAFLDSVEHEEPMLKGQILALDPRISAEEFWNRLDENAASFDDRRVRYVEAARQVNFLQPVAVPPDVSAPWRPGGVYLIVGGAGAIGRVFVEEIQRRQPTAMTILAGRASSVEGLPAQSRSGGVEYRACDVTDALAVRRLVADILVRHGRLDGVIHAPGVLSDGWIIGKDDAVLRQVLSPKVRGIVNLDAATAEIPLDFFMAFSSIAGAIGNAGQCDYATANAFLDHYLSQRAASVRAGSRSGRSLSLGWPLWRSGGMRVDDGVIARTRDGIGLSPIGNAEAIEAFYAACSTDRSYVAVFKGDIARLTDARSRSRSLAASASETIPVQSTSALPPREVVERYLQGLIERALKMPTERVSSEAPLENYGIDSVMALEMTAELEQVLGKLSKTLFFQHRSIADLATYLLETKPHACAALAGFDTRENAAGSKKMDKLSAPAAASAEIACPVTDIAIIGIAGSYPGARDLEAFWDNLAAGRESIGEIPADRWDFKPYYHAGKGVPGTIYCKWGGFIEGVDEFDALFFGISPLDAKSMGPQERLFLQCTYSAIEDAGYTRTSLSSRSINARARNIGVFAGVMYDEYQLFNSMSREVDAVGPSSNPASVANRVSYFCDFRGPSLAVNTMCSSSLTAIHLACDSLRAGHCEVAIAGGVNVSIHPSKYITLSQGQFVSGTGHCCSFGKGADGYVPGEGVGAVILKPLTQALADGDHVHAVIKASGVNHGGRGAGYTVPLASSQADLIGDLLKTARIPAAAVSYIEAHGTGTALGDPIEMDGLKTALGAEPSHSCAVGSVKSNIGHGESAAGIAGLTKIVLQMRHAALVPSLHSSEINENIDLAQTRFYVPQRVEAWRPMSGIRIAGISSFGAGGANAHLIVADTEPSLMAKGIERNSERPVMVVLSARSPERLTRIVERLRDACESLSEGDLASIAYTLQTGREEMEFRCAWVVDSLDALRKALEASASGLTLPQHGHRGSAPYLIPETASDVEAATILALDPSTRTEGLETLASLWVVGAGIAWAALYPQGAPGRIPLPTYPFERKRHWVDTGSIPVKTAPKETPVAMPQAPLHPLLHLRDTGATFPRFVSQFTGEEFFLCDHVVDGRKILPAAACLEMVRAAAVESSHGFALGQGCSFQIADVSWLRPIGGAGAPVAIATELDRRPNGDFGFRVVDLAPVGSATEKIYATGVLRAANGPVSSVYPASNVAASLAKCRSVLTGPECYEIFWRSGIDYRETFRGLDSLHLGSSDGLPFAVARFTLPDGLAAADPAGSNCVVLDLALQACLGVTLQRHEVENQGYLSTLELPFAMDSLTVHSPLPPCGHIVAAARSDGKLDIAIHDADQRLVATFEGISVRQISRSTEHEREEALLLAPRWVVDGPRGAVPSPPTRARVLVVGDAGPRSEWLDKRFPNRLSALDAKVAGDIVAALPEDDFIDHVVWLPTKSDPAKPGSFAELATAQETGVVAAFRLVKALLAAGYGARPLGWTIITVGTQRVLDGEMVNAAQAALHGFFGSLGKEHDAWLIRLADIAADELTVPESLWNAPVVSGETLAIRKGEVFRQRLVRQTMARSFPPFRWGGVYVIVGGAGGVGEALTAHLLRSAQAQVIWLGRREPDAELLAKLDRLALLGPRPVYIQADAADALSLAQARRTIDGLHPEIHGVVCATLGLADGTVANMDEAALRLALRAKVDVSTSVVDAFGQNTRDFILFFSSMQSFAKPAGQSNYAAGSTFLDAFCAQLQGQLPLPVKTMNWGYWGQVGAVASPVMRARMAAAGIGSIDARRGMAALDQLLQQNESQLAFVVTLGVEGLGALPMGPAGGHDNDGETRAPAVLHKLLAQRAMSGAD